MVNYGEGGGATKREGGGCEVLITEMGGGGRGAEQVLAMLKGVGGGEGGAQHVLG